MSEQALDLRRSARILRRHTVLVGVAVVLGILAGGAYAARHPPMLTSTALVSLPQNVQSENGAAVTVDGGTDPYTATQEVIAGSNQVLSAARPDVRPAMSLGDLSREIQIGSLTPYVLSVSAKGKVAADTEATANAVARSYITYVGSPGSVVGRVQAQLLEPATSATRSPVKQFVVDLLIGAVFGALIGVVAALAIGRRDRRLRERDEIADSIGVPVLASVSVDRPSSAAGWTRLLAVYKPGAVDAWRLRQALYRLGLAGTNSADPDSGSGSSLAVLSLSTDHKALALGPQLASFAASAGIPTALVVGPQQDPHTAATLRAACAAPGPPTRSGHLRLTVSDDEDVGEFPGAALTVVVGTVDGKAPRVADTMRAAVTVLGVSAGAATAEQLARVAASAAADGRDLAGILMADPEAADPTTGRLPQVARPARPRMPTRTSGIATESGR